MSGTVSTADDDDIISAGRPLPRIAAVQIIDGFRVEVVWRNGVAKTVDLAPAIFSHRHFIPLRDDDDLFQTVRVDEDGVALEWDGGIELTADWIDRLPPFGMSNGDFRRIMDGLKLTLDGMAAQLGISRRQVAAFRGAKPIPNHIAFAMLYLIGHGTKSDVMQLEQLAREVLRDVERRRAAGGEERLGA
jgi:Protein of unknown function (DUF2442)